MELDIDTFLSLTRPDLDSFGDLSPTFKFLLIKKIEKFNAEATLPQTPKKGI